jgi:hypothetical protein
MAPPIIFGLVVQLVDGAHHADRVERIRADRHDVRIGRLDRAHDRREIGGGRRIAAVIDDLEAELLGVLARALAGVVGELGVGRDQRRRSVGFGFCAAAVSKKPSVNDGFGSGPGRDHREELVVLELGVHREAEQNDEHLVLLHDHRHGRRRHVGRVRADHEVDFVDVEQLGVDAGDRGRVGLIVVIDELNRPPEQAALRVDLLFPDLHAEQCLLAIRGERAGERHREADGDRIAALR